MCYHLSPGISIAYPLAYFREYVILTDASPTGCGAILNDASPTGCGAILTLFLCSVLHDLFVLGPGRVSPTDEKSVGSSPVATPVPLPKRTGVTPTAPLYQESLVS